MNEKYPLALPEGTVLAGQYIIENVLGQGGFGITYEARDHKTGERVAVKEFFPDAMATRTEHTTVSAYSGERGESFAYGKTCFLQEAETLAKFIGNENIVRIHSYFEENGTAYFVMDFIEGTSFDEYLRERGGKIPFEEAARILIPVMDALSAVHSQGIIHRDVTPDNIYITNEGVVKLLDFGAARYSLGDKSRSLDIILKHGFAPKEQYTRRGKQGPYTDVYALGATFYFALTGKRPPDSVERMDEDDLVPPSSLGVEIGHAAEDAILKALSIQPAERFQSMLAFKNAMHISQQEPEPVLAAAAPAVSQTYFSAPAQSGILRTEPMGAPAPGPTQAADFQSAPSAPAKPVAGKKRLPLLIGGGVAAALLIVVIALNSFGKSPGAVPGSDPEPADPPSEETAEPATSDPLNGPTNGSPDDPSNIPPDDPFNETQPDEAPATEPAAQTGSFALVGNYIGNILNDGLIAFNSRGDIYYIDHNGHSLYSEATGGYLYQDPEGNFTDLSCDDGKLFFCYKNFAYAYHEDTQELEKIEYLNNLFGGSIARLILTEDYYVVGVYNQGTVMVYCVLRDSGDYDYCCTTEDSNTFTLSDDGWIYYTGRQDDEAAIFRARLDGSGAPECLAVNHYEYAAFSNPIVVGDYLYACMFSTADNDDYGVLRVDRNSGYQDGDPVWSIASELRIKRDIERFPYIGFNVNRNNHDIYFCFSESETSVCYLYEMEGHSDGTFNITQISQSSYRPNIVYYWDGSYQLNFFHFNEDDGQFYLYYHNYDANGNLIQNN